MTERFNGTSISPAHVGDTIAENLDVVSFSISDGGEAGGGAAANEFRVTLQAKDANDKDLKEVVRLEVRMHDADLEHVAVTAHTISVITGTAVTADAKPGLVLDTDANGTAVVDVLDVSGVLAAATWLRANPVNRAGEVAWHQMTFA